MEDTALDNRAAVVIGGKEIEVEASNLAAVIYKRQFRRPKDPKDGSPFTGNLVQDISEEYVLHGPQTGEIPDWDDYSHLLGAVWAMAKAAGSVRQEWPAFRDRALRSTMSMLEPAAAASVVFNDLAPRTFFRGIAGGAGADGASDHVDGGDAS